jgi:hypothetical protein
MKLYTCTVDTRTEVELEAENDNDAYWAALHWGKTAAGVVLGVSVDEVVEKEDLEEATA